MSGIPGFFGSLFGELLLDKHCPAIEADPDADPTEKEICRSFKEFHDSLKKRKFEFGDEDSLDRQFGDLPSPSHRPQPDQDLDKELKRNPRLFDQIIKDDCQPSPQQHSAYSSVVITTKLKPDGSYRYEERRRVRDSTGRDEVTIRRSDGTTTHTEITSTDKDGSKVAYVYSSPAKPSNSFMDKLTDWIWNRK